MTKKIRLFIMMTAFCFFSCAPNQIIQTKSTDLNSGNAIFFKAENLFQENSYDAALKVFLDYLNKYPNGPFADSSLMKIGAIYSIQEKSDAKRKAYQWLIKDYPNSRFVPDAMLEILISYNEEGKLRGVILQAADIIEKLDSRVHLVRTYTVLGDTYMSTGSPMEAISFYTIAFQKAKSLEKELIIKKLKIAVNHLSEENIISLLLKVGDKFPRSYLIYQLGIKKFEEQKFKEALKIFLNYVEEFPKSENINQAKNLIERINQIFAFDPHTIGCILPLSGSYAAYGKRTLRGIQFALTKFNANKEGPLINLVVKDTQTDPKQSIQDVLLLDQEKVAAIIGPIATCKSAALEAQKRKIPLITLTPEIDINKVGDFVFRNFLTAQIQVDTIVPYVIEKLGISRFAILYPNEKYGKIFMKLFSERVTSYGGTIAAVESYNPKHTDFAKQIKKLGEFNDSDLIENKTRTTSKRRKRYKEPEILIDFDAIFIPDTSEKVGLIAPQLRFHNIENILLLGTNLLHSDKLIKMARDYVQGTIMTVGFNSESDQKHIMNFIDGFEEMYGEKPGLIEAVAFDTAMIVFQTVSQPDIKSRGAIKSRLSALRNYKGVTGLTSFLQNGDVQKQAYLLQIKEDEFVNLDNR